MPPLLRRAWYSLNQAFRRRINHLNLTPDQFTVLRWLIEGPRRGLTQRELTDLMASDPNTIASLLKRMEGNGTIDRQTDPADRRANRVRITPAGRKAYRDAARIAQQLQNDVLAVFNESQRETFLKHLEQVADAAREQLDASP